jgi:hypothetical protein
LLIGEYGLTHGFLLMNAYVMPCSIIQPTLVWHSSSGL